MSLPELLAETVGDESVVAAVSLGGDDRLAVTPTRTLIYRGDGLLSDESVAEYSHDVERIALSTGRRKAKLTLDYGLDGDETLSVPTKRADEVLHPILAGVLSASGVTGPGESVVRTFRFSELTLVVTSDRLVKHVGSAVWDDEFEEFPYASLTDLDFEEGTVATAVVLTHDGRSERFKAPNESARAVRETLVDAVCAFHGVDSLEEFRVTVAEDGDGESGGSTEDAATSTTDFGEGPDPLSASPVADAEAEAEAEAGSGTNTAVETDRTTEATGTGGTAGTSADPLSADVGDAEPSPDVPTEAADEDQSEGAAAARDATNTDVDAIDDSVGGHPADADLSRSESDDGGGVDTGSSDGPAADFATVGTGEPDPASPATDTSANAADIDDATDDAFDGSPFETAGIEGEDLATEVAELRHAVETQSERLDRQSALIEQLIAELRRGR
ncbi:DUF7115 domain-containing protein [Halorubrum sp. DTA46]|uniref:DUF7115 domain-containing protein n=1 Tax=Halorubrum sp. DTA46 TaxID=3402162 RepID=UPI003AAFC827